MINKFNVNEIFIEGLNLTDSLREVHTSLLNNLLWKDHLATKHKQLWFVEELSPHTDKQDKNESMSSQVNEEF